MPTRIKKIIRRRNVPESKFQKAFDYFAECGYDLYEYQQEGVRFMVQRETDPEFRSAGLLCDEPGLGKTIQTVATMYINPKLTLLVLPKCVISQWRDVLKLIFPDVGIYIHHGQKRCFNLNELRDELSRSQIVLTTYGTFNDVLPLHKWGRIVYDEIHFLRNRKTSRSRAAREMNSSCYWGLTGTPVNNEIDDLKTIYKVLHFPEIVLEKSESDYFEDLNRRYIMRRTKRDVEDINPLLKLPELRVRTVTTQFKYKEEWEVHRDVMEQIYKRYGENPNWKLVTLEWLMRMRQATIHPRLVDVGLDRKWGLSISELKDACRVKSTKFEVMLEMIKKHLDEKTLIFNYYREEMDILTTVLARADIRVFRIDGSMSIEEREDEVSEFRSTDLPSVMMIQIAAGSVGMNLQFASRVYITSPHYNPSVEIQAIARAHRIGQTRPVEVVRLAIVEDGFIETSIMEKQAEKRYIMSMVFDDDKLNDNGTVEEISRTLLNRTPNETARRTQISL